MRFVSILSLSLIILSGCGAVKPEAPEIIVQENYVLDEAPLSSIKVPIKINLKPYFEETDQSIDRTFEGGEQQCSGISYKYKFQRGPIHFKGDGKKLHFDVDGRYALWLNYCPTCTDLFSSEPYCVTPRIYTSCGVDEPMREIHVGYTTKIGVTNNYSLTSKTELRTVKALSPCKISIFEYDATATIEEEVAKALKKMEKDIDHEISAVSLKPEMQETWDLLGEPTDLEGYGFLELNPEEISIDRILYEGDTAYFNAVLTARPVIRSQKTTVTSPPLPNLSKYEDRDGFDITMDIFTNYDSLNAILDEEISGQRLELKGKEIIFDNVTVYGAYNHQLNIKIDFSGSKKGTFYLTGTPVFDAAKQHISFPDLTFDIKSKSALLKSAKWLFDNKVTNLIREQASMDLAPYLEELKISLNESINGALDEGVYMYGEIDKVLIHQIQPMHDQLHLRINSLGRLGIRLD